MADDRQNSVHGLSMLGINPDYGTDPCLPCYAEARDLVEVELNFAGKMQLLTPDTAKHWGRMKQAARDNGVVLQLVSGFRSIARQKELIENKLAAGQNIVDILKVNAAPGFSQHHTGMAMDLNTIDCEPLTEVFEHTAAFSWLVEHAAAFGFSMPYCRDNRYGFCYEPWHWSITGLDET